jgi:hypothetical protein
MPSLLAGMPFVKIEYRNSCRPSSGLLAEAPLRSNMSRFVILDSCLRKDRVREHLEIQFRSPQSGLSALRSA